MDMEKEIKQTVMMMIFFTFTGEKRRRATHTPGMRRTLVVPWPNSW
jgi:hypothetical protein